MNQLTDEMHYKIPHYGTLIDNNFQSPLLRDDVITSKLNELYFHFNSELNGEESPITSACRKLQRNKSHN